MLAAAAGGLTVLGILAFAVRRMARKKGLQVKTNATLPPAADGKALSSGAKHTAPLQDANAPSLQEANPEAAKMDRLVGTVRTAVSSDPTLVAGVLRNWLEER